MKRVGRITFWCKSGQMDKYRETLGRGLALLRLGLLVVLWTMAIINKRLACIHAEI